jgi:hypothetical protein
MIAPIMTIDNQVYMSLTPMEIQSAALAIYLAEGDVSTCGLGMGYFTLRCAEKDAVNKVIVYERDADVIEYFTRNFSDRKGYDKITIIEGDARENLQDKKCDFLFVDTYAEMLSDDIVDDIELYSSSNEIGEYWFWGIERVLLNALVNTQISPYDIPPELQLYFVNWQISEQSNLWFGYRDEEYIVNVLTALAESACSSLDLYVA